MLPPCSPAPPASAPAWPAPHGHAADSTPAQTAALAFIERWRHVAASELATAQTFVTELCALLGVPAPDPAGDGSYTFEKPVTFHHGDGSTSAGRIDCYRRGAFVLEAKKLREHRRLRRRHAACAPAGRRLRPRAAARGRPPGSNRSQPRRCKPCSPRWPIWGWRWKSRPAGGRDSGCRGFFSIGSVFELVPQHTVA